MLEILFSVISIMFVLVIQSLIYSKISQNKFYINKTKFMKMTIITIILILMNNFNNIFLDCLSSILLYLLLVIINSEGEKIFNIIKYSSIMWGLNIFLEGILSIFMSTYFVTSAAVLKSNLYMKSLFTIIYNFIIGLIFLFFPMKRFKRIYRFKNYMKEILVGIIVIIIESSIYGIIIALNNIGFKEKILILINLLLFNLLLYYFLIHLVSEKETILINKNLIKDNIMYTGEIKEYREFKHNIIHNLKGIKSVANKKTNALIDNTIKKYYDKKDFSSNFEEVKLNWLIYIIYEYLYNDKEKLKIIINNNVKNKTINKINNHKHNDLFEALGILLDNAREAALNSIEKIIIIDIYLDSIGLNIEVKNTFNNTIDTSKLGEKIYSTKSNHYGLGIYSIQKNSSVTSYIKINNNVFTHKLILKL